MNNINTNGINHFIERLTTLTKLKNVKEKIREIGEEEFVKAYYSDSDFTQLKIYSEVSDDKVVIYAKDLKLDTDIAFIEFGTGYYGLHYEGKLPTKTITFTTESGRQGSTAGWVYYYDSPAKRDRPSMGGLGWYLPKIKGGYFDKGTYGAHNTFYRACQAIKKRLKKELKLYVL